MGPCALSAWVKCDSWKPDVVADVEGCPEQWIHLGHVPPRAPLTCSAFHERLDPNCEQPILEFVFMALETEDSRPDAPELTALIPYDATRNYQLVLGRSVMITARRPSPDAHSPR